jgi:primosomal protein N' (replication factor Y) (superfamily II helicase)
MRVEVALPVPVPRTFVYDAPAEATREGTRVRVRFSGRTLVGWVVGAAEDRDVENVRPVERVLDHEPSVPAELLRLCRWIADYYLAPLGVVLRAALPAVLSDTGRERAPEKTRQVLRITRELPSLAERDTLFGRAERQRACYEAVEAMGGAAEVAHLVDRLGFSRAIVKGVAARAVAAIEEWRMERDPFAAVPVAPPPALQPTPAQAAAIRAILTAPRAPGRPAPPVLLLGITGSGKTLVYVEVLKDIVQGRGGGAIVLVPEIALTPQTVARFRAHFGDDVAVLHSGLSDGERYDAWLALRRGERRIAIGARSAIFAPVRDLGVIIVDEEHEGTYKQSEAPRYHAREVAIMRARLAGAVCVLGSATPSLESFHNAERGKYALLRLPARAGGQPLPPVRVIDLRKQERHTADRARASLSAPLVEAIQASLDRAEQVILLLNRRGYATFVQCRACGHVWQCPHCNVSLTFHRGRRRLVCHYCLHEEAPPAHCAECDSGDLSFRGVGTEQVEREVAETFPSARIARMDVDTTSGKWAHHHILGRVERHEVDILLGTQMIAKGLDFPDVTLVGVINADVAMSLPDFRASERTFQLLTQVAGRAGRGPRGGQVLIQTALPTHYVVTCALTHDYDGFAERELAERITPRYPPHTRLANIVISGTDEAVVRRVALETAAWTADGIARSADADARSADGAGRTADVTLTGPAPCAIDRIRGRWRWHFLLRSASARALGAVLRQLQKRSVRPGAADVRIVIDRDPVTLL